MKFSEKLQKSRKENHLSQEQLADMLDVSRQSVSKWESGQTYPEMDKLIAMCKIFKCSLDDLTNDEVTDINITNKQKNNFTNIIDEILDMINRTFNMFKKMSSKDIAQFVIEMFIMLIILLLFRLPFKYICYLGNEIFINFPGNTGNILSGLLNLVLTVSYFILCVIIFVYIYKIRYLDKYDNVLDNDKNNLNDVKNNDDNKSDEPYNYTENSNSKVMKRSSAIFSTLGNIVMLFIKFVAAFIGLPFIASLMFMFASLVMCIVLMFKGIIFIGIFIGIISAILLNILILELLFNFIFNKKNSVKRIFITLIVSLAGLGIGFGITILDVTSITYINDVPDVVKNDIITKEFEMNDNLVIVNDYVEFKEDETLGNKIIMDIEYYKDYTKYSIVDDSNHIFIHNYYSKGLIENNQIDLFIDNLSNKRFYNYYKLYEANITVRATSENINKLKNNYKEYTNSIESIDNEYDNQIEYYENELENRDDKIYSLEEKIEELNDQITEYKDKIQEYKDGINSLINE